MAQPRLAQITCSECNGWYISDSALREHMQTAHRRSISQHNIFQMNQWRFTHPVILVTMILNSVSNPITVVIENTTLSVVAFPTPSAPPVTVRPW